SIADFRSDNRAAFKKVFRQFVILCRRLDLFGRELLAVDGTRIKAVNNKDRNFTTGSLQKFIEAADKKLEDYLKRLDAGDAEERATGGSRVENLTEKIEALERSAANMRRIVPRWKRTAKARCRSRIPTVAPWPPIRRSGSGRGRRKAQDDRRTGSDQPGPGHGPAEGHSGAGV